MSIRVRRKRAAGLVVAAALVASLVGIQIASAEDPPDAGPRIDAGTLALHVNGSTNDDYWSYTEASGQQSIRVSRCAPTYSGSTYVTHGSEPGTSTVGFLDGYGVKTSGEGNAGKCAQVNTPDQKLKLFLANGSLEALDGLYADSAELDIEAKFNAFINIALFKDGVQVDADPSAEGLILVEDCTSSGSDCGPDSADGDNFRIVVPEAGTVLFDEVHLWATSGGSGGGVVLEGGADAGTSDSTFHLVQPAEGDLDCGNTVSDGPTDVYRGPNKVANDPCLLVPYTLTTTFTDTEQSVEFLWDEESQPNAQYKFVIPWPASTDDNPTYAANQTFYNVGAGDKPLLFCDGMTPSQGGVSFPVGSLSANASATSTTLTVGAGTETPPDAPFDIFVDAEWMRVTAAVGTTWSVQRAYGGTAATTHSAGTDNVFLALPIYPDDEQACLSNTSTVGVTGPGGLETQTTEEIWLKGDIKVFR